MVEKEQTVPVATNTYFLDIVAIYSVSTVQVEKKCLLWPLVSIECQRKNTLVSQLTLNNYFGWISTFPLPNCGNKKN
uniref:Ovule protein n=1 Tax=Strongyloides venezuelensis TaxID=75913 RepID=A0A0K0G5M3_STRVS